MLAIIIRKLTLQQQHWTIGHEALLTIFRKGDDTIGNPYRTQISHIRYFGAYPLIEIRQSVPYRAIRGNSISVSSTFLPL